MAKKIPAVVASLIISVFLYPAGRSSSVALREAGCFPTGGGPKSVVMSPQGDIAVVSNLEDGTVWLFDTHTKKPVGKIVFFKTKGTGFNYKTNEEIPSVQEKPVESAFSGNGRFIWISLHNAYGVVVYDREEKLSAGKSYKKAVIEDAGGKRVVNLPFIKTGKTPKAISVSPDDRWVYVSNWHSNDVSVINATTFERLKNVAVGRIPRGIAFTPDGRYAYITIMGGSSLSKMDVAGHKVVENPEIGLNPRHIVISKDGKFLYASLNIPAQVVKFDLQMGAPMAGTPVGWRPRTIELSGDERYLFTANYIGNSISIVNAASMELVRTVPSAEVHPCGLCVSPDGKELWVTNYTGNKVCVYEIIEQ